MRTIFYIVFIITVIASLALFFYANRPLAIIDFNSTIKVKSNTAISVNGAVYPVVDKNDILTIFVEYTKYLDIHENTYRSIHCVKDDIESISFPDPEKVEKDLEMGHHIIEYNNFILPYKVPVNAICHVEYFVSYQPFLSVAQIIQLQTEPFYVVEEVQE